MARSPDRAKGQDVPLLSSSSLGQSEDMTATQANVIEVRRLRVHRVLFVWLRTRLVAEAQA